MNAEREMVRDLRREKIKERERERERERGSEDNKHFKDMSLVTCFFYLGPIVQQ
jgi:hypothetical protein